MVATYDKKRKDITFCTMLFEMPNSEHLAKLKNQSRKFDEFYLPSLKHLIETFERVAIWCDQRTATYLRKHGLDKKINMRVMKLSQLPHWDEREQSLEIMKSMSGYVGYFLHRRTPEMWKDYLPLMFAKAAVVNWAAQNNKFKSKYFMWFDAGAFSPVYANSRVWDGWTNTITATPPHDRVRFSIQPTMGKSRPHFVPRFIYDLYRWLFVPPIPPATAKTLANQSLRDIAMTNADYDVPGGCFIVPYKMVSKFYTAFERTIKILNRHSLTCVDQGVFQAMMKLDTEKMFELVYVDSYQGLYNTIANGKTDHLLD